VSAAETDLKILLQSIAPTLDSTDFVFLTFPGAGFGEYADLQPVVFVVEDEGMTLVVPKALADQKGLNYEGVFKRITLQVHSSLEAVGLTAAFAAKLTDHDISANVVAGYYHDHIFVSASQAASAMAALAEFS